MPSALERSAALAASTARDILRRPGALLAVLLSASLLLLLPRIARRALDAGGSLGIELTISTLALHGSLIGGLVGVAAGSKDSPLGPVAEFLTTPLTWSQYVLARATGVSGAAIAQVLLLSAVAALAIALHDPHDLPGAGVMAAGAISVGLQIMLYVSAGICAGALAGTQLGLVLLVAFFAATRMVIPNLAAEAGWWMVLLPDPARADMARELALGRPIGAGAWVAVVGATVLQSAGLLLAAIWRLSTDANALHPRAT